MYNNKKYNDFTQYLVNKNQPANAKTNQYGTVIGSPGANRYDSVAVGTNAGASASNSKYAAVEALIAAGKGVTVAKDANGNAVSSVDANGNPVFVNKNNFDEPPEVAVPEQQPQQEEAVAVGANAGMSYEEYLRTFGGVDTKQQYAENVRQANSDYYRTLATYGQRAERLASGGLAGSGMSDYGNAAAYAARQGAVNAAGAIKAETDRAQTASFNQYLQNERAKAEATAEAEKQAAAQNKLNLLNTMVNMGVKDEEGAKALAGLYGVDNASVSELMASINAINNAQKLKVDTENYAAAADAYNNARANGASHESAVTILSQQGITDSEIIEKLKSDYENIGASEIKTTLDQAFASSSYSVAMPGEGYYGKEWLDMQVATGAIDGNSEEYKVELGRIQGKNFESLISLIDGAHDEGTNGVDVEAVCTQFGIDLNGVDMEDEDNRVQMSASVIKQIRERASQLFHAGDISEEQYGEYLEKDFAYELDGRLNSTNDNKPPIREICSALASEYSKRVRGMNNGDAVMDALYKQVADIDGIDVKITHKQTAPTEDNYEKIEILIGGETIETVKPRNTEIVEYSETDVLEKRTVKGLGTVIVLGDGTIGYVGGNMPEGKLMLWGGLQTAKGWTDDMGNAFLKLVAAIMTK